MPGVVETTDTFATNQVITSTLMNNIIDQTLFTSQALAAGTGTLELVAGRMKVATNGITSNEMGTDAVTENAIAADAVTTAKILDLNVTTGKIADLGVTTSKIADTSITAAKIAYSNFPIQVVQVVKSDIQTVVGNASAFTDIVGLTLTLTRVVASASGKIRVQANILGSSNNANYGLILRIMRDSTVIGVGNAAGSRVRATSNTGYNGAYGNNPGIIDFIDTAPGSSATVTYKIEVRTHTGVEGYINRVNTDTDITSFVPRTISTLTLTELTP